MSMEQSFCYNWQAGMAKHPILFDVHSEVAEALIGFLDDSSLLPLDALFQKDMDSLTSTPSAYGGEAASSILLPSPKRHRSCSDLHNIHEQPPTLFQPSPFLYPIVEPSMAVVTPADCSGGSSLSVQSVAARERRKRISEKMLELGRLIPSGIRMNTAEMLQAAFKYVNFLQAQVSILHLMASIPECRCAKEKELQLLLASPVIQERLSAEGMCIVPKEMMAELAADAQLQSRPLISRSMEQFIQSIIRIEGCN